MADDVALGHVDDVFGDVGCEVGYSLQAARDRQQSNQDRDVVRCVRFREQVCHSGRDLSVQVVDLVVGEREAELHVEGRFDRGAADLTVALGDLAAGAPGTTITFSVTID